MPRSDPYLFALVGSGFVGRLYASAIRACPDAALGRLVVSDRSFDRRAQLALEFEVDEAMITKRYDDVLDDRDVDVVIIGTPNPLHAQQMLRCIEAGKPFIVEKPVVCNQEQLRRVLPALRDCPVKSLSGQVLRYSEIFETAKALVASGELGRVTSVSSQYVVNAVAAVRSQAKPWWRSPENDEFAVIGAGVHSIDLMRWLAGEIAEVHALGEKAILRDVPYHDTVAATLRFENGALGSFYLDFSAQRPAAVDLAVYGTQGTLTDSRLFLNAIPNLENFIDLPVPALSFDNLPFPRLVSHMVEYLDSAVEPVCGALDGCMSAAVCLAIAESIRQGRSVRIEELLG